ncbi:SigE family RNA polymerase sigma factor [Streptomyces sp. AM 3-1-1]|uniref:SigE family RNA polymerase sigma factor n=1 Tax=Streptomyces sp. AM 3-1-1 TaxID=3028711 RepID=UPI0023B8C083|nr:SigE family RNA polymerase sigma factor [Streptomyces sp. AM 3-1-1]WEH31670.1 SigE family RNA polymerase sigma factor [Streptomyces sp. AM 3-1-1]
MPRTAADRDRAAARTIAEHAATARKAEARRPEARTNPEPAPGTAPQPRLARARARSPRTAPALPLTFESYVRARGAGLLRTARSLTPNPYDAEDLLQTALAKTFSAWERIEDHGAVDGYVRRALVNTRTSQWRKRRVDEYSCAELPEPEPLPATDPAEAQAMRDAMWHAVLRLPARQRAMVTLRYYEDLSEAQTAEVLGVSVGTVKSAVSRALAKLREDRELALLR